LKDVIDRVLGAGGLLIGWKTCRGPQLRRLAVFRRLGEAQAFVLDPLCAANPVMTAISLGRRGAGRIGLVLRGCEVRSLVEALRSRQLDRARLDVHVVRCGGVADAALLGAALREGGAEGEVVSATDAGGDFEVLLEGGAKVRVEKDRVLLRRCFDCRMPPAFAADSMEPGALEPPAVELPPSRRGEDEDPSRLFEGCILCMACRSACPGCFCKACVFDGGLRKKLTPWMFHLTRTMHLAGRCTQCGECERVCPAGLPVQAMRRRLEKIIEEKYGFKGAGMSEEAKLPMLDWGPDD
jgi:formate dehydrogenase subunit beta